MHNSFNSSTHSFGLKTPVVHSVLGYDDICYLPNMTVHTINTKILNAPNPGGVVVCSFVSFNPHGNG